MKYSKITLFTIITYLVTIPYTLLAAPHEPSPAGGGWCEINPALSTLETESPWFPDYKGPLTLEAWIYIDAPPRTQAAFSIAGQTNRFNWAILGGTVDCNADGIPDAIGAILTDATGMITAHLPSKRWIHYVTTIDDGVTVGSNGFITGKSQGKSLKSTDNPLTIGGVPILKEMTFPDNETTVPTAGVYIDELRISRTVRYNSGEKYMIPQKAFTPDTDTLGLYHFDAPSTEHYMDASKNNIALIRSSRQPTPNK